MKASTSTARRAARILCLRMPLPALLSLLTLTSFVTLLKTHAQDSSVRVEMFAFKPGGYLRVENPRGATRIETWNNPKIHIIAEKKGPTGRPLDSSELALSGDENTVSIQCRQGGRPERVNITVYLPGHSHLQVTGGEWPVEVTGSLRSVVVETTGGNIDYFLPVSDDAQVALHSARGVVRSMLPLALHERAGLRSLQGRLGRGGAPIILNSRSGDITIRPAPDAPRMAVVVEAPPGRTPDQARAHRRGGNGAPDYSPRDQTQRAGDRRPQRQAGPDEPVPGSPTVFPPDSSPPSSGPPRQGGGTVIAQDRQTRGTTGTSRSGPWRGQRQGSASSSGSFEIGVQVIRPGSSHDPSGDPRYPDEPPGRPQQDPATQRPLPGSVDDQPDRRDTQTGAPSGSGDVVAPYPTRKGSARRPGRDDSVWPPAADPPSPAAGDEANDPPVNIASAEPRPKSPPVLRRGNTGDPVSPAAPAADRRDSEDTIVLKTSLVSLNVSVTDRSGKCLSDLKREDFQVFEDDAPQQVEFFAPTSAPFNLVLLLDLSGSISDKIDVVKTAALRFLEVIGPQDKVAVVTFTRRVRVLSGLTADRDLLRKRIKEVEKSEGGTALYEAVWFALVDTLRGTQGQRNAIVVMTDGVDNSLEWFGHAPSRVSFEQLAQRLEESDVIAFPIYIDTEEEMVWNRMVSSPAAYDAARAHLRQIAELTGGQMFRADKVKDLARVYDQVAAALRTIYSVGYYPTNQERDGTFRRVRVQVNRADAATRTRRGYYAN